uniref:Uncharacterized protein n=1 Tax=Norrisiella sphaerica TaxID=552664 RepID=A0A7S2QS34_9EUKA|mmetsp:Transcript_153/g.210  ORF Transcript_153/g.210 Transcript_153/m.210 type:complete len:446 (+) Transcript_153:3-1340(+)
MASDVRVTSMHLTDLTVSTDDDAEEEDVAAGHSDDWIDKESQSVEDNLAPPETKDEGPRKATAQDEVKLEITSNENESAESEDEHVTLVADAREHLSKKKRQTSDVKEINASVRRKERGEELKAGTQATRPTKLSLKEASPQKKKRRKRKIVFGNKRTKKKVKEVEGEDPEARGNVNIYRTSKGDFEVRLRRQGKTYDLGCFKTLEEAAGARDAKIAELEAQGIFKATKARKKLKKRRSAKNLGRSSRDKGRKRKRKSEVASGDRGAKRTGSSTQKKVKPCTRARAQSSEAGRRTRAINSRTGNRNMKKPKEDDEVEDNKEEKLKDRGRGSDGDHEMVGLNQRWPPSEQKYRRIQAPVEGPAYMKCKPGPRKHVERSEQGAGDKGDIVPILQKLPIKEQIRKDLSSYKIGDLRDLTIQDFMTMCGRVDGIILYRKIQTSLGGSSI